MIGLAVEVRDVARAAVERLAASVVGLPVVRIVAGRLELAYTKARPEIQHVVEASSDLQLWNSDGVDQGGAGPAVTASVPLTGSGSRRFLRLRVTLP